jgi:hypothetical protein
VYSSIRVCVRVFVFPNSKKRENGMGSMRSGLCCEHVGSVCVNVEFCKDLFVFVSSERVAGCARGLLAHFLFI